MEKLQAGACVMEKKKKENERVVREYVLPRRPRAGIGKGRV